MTDAWTGLSAEQHDLLDHSGVPGVGGGGGGGGDFDSRYLFLVADGVAAGDSIQLALEAVVIGRYIWAPYCPMAANGMVTVNAIATANTGHISYCQVTVRKVADADGVPILPAATPYYGYYQAPPLPVVTLPPMTPAQLDLAYEADPNANYELFEAAPNMHVIRVLSAGVYAINVLPQWVD